MATRRITTDLFVADSAESVEKSQNATLRLGEPSAAPLWLLEASGEMGLTQATIAEGEVIEIGAAVGAGLRLFDRAVSARHARAAVVNGRLCVADLGSSNGVYFGAVRVAHANVVAGACFVVGRSVVTCSPMHAKDAFTGPDGAPLEGVVGDSLAMRLLAQQVRKVARLRASVLIQGETGTGKDVIARALHALSGERSQGPFVPLNMGSLSSEIADSELFGHERGAFTNAVAAKRGAFEEAAHGTLFLDEIAELPIAMQAKLLRTLESGEVRPVGASRARQIDARVIAATWVDVDARAAEGLFRDDLLHRLAVFRIRIPPLRDRRGDIPALAQLFLNEHAREIGSPLSLSSCAIAKLVACAWPGNVRELRNVLFRAAVEATGPLVLATHIDAAQGEGPRAEMLRREAIKLDRGAAAREAIEANRGNISAAARALGVQRSTLRAWLGRGVNKRKGL